MNGEVPVKRILCEKLLFEKEGLSEGSVTEQMRALKIKHRMIEKYSNFEVIGGFEVIGVL